MRIGVYAIALNEATFAERWTRSAKDADYIFVADTGSTDGTPEQLTSYGVHVRSITVRPWRFDDARNAALHMLPADLDVVVALDMDEVLVSGWRERIIRYWSECSRLRYRYVWSWTPTGTPDVLYYDVKICSRFGWRWKYPIHEVLVPTIPGGMVTCEDILVEHHADASKSRSQYLPLLELAVAEDPHDSRCLFLLGRELFTYHKFSEAIATFERYLALPAASWGVERAAAMRHMAKSYEMLGQMEPARTWFIRATLEDPTSREILVDAARFLSNQKQFYAALDLCERALAAPKDLSPQQDERYARMEGPYDVMAVAYFALGNQRRAIEAAERAVALNPHEPRLQTNLQTIRAYKPETLTDTADRL